MPIWRHVAVWLPLFIVAFEACAGDGGSRDVGQALGDGAPSDAGSEQVRGDGAPSDGGSEVDRDATPGGADGCSLDAGRSTQKIVLAKTEPTVLLLVEQSGSMTNTDFPLADGGTTDRWNGLRDAFLDPAAGVVDRLQTDVDFGTSFFSWDDKNIAACPQVFVGAAVAANNFQSIASEWRSLSPIGDGPTGDGIRRATGVNDGGVIVDGGLAALPTGGPKVLVLITDGDPDSCYTYGRNTDPSQAIAIAATQDAFKAGIETYVVGIKSGVSDGNLQQLANAGVGLDPLTGKAPYFYASSQDALIKSLGAIVTRGRTCTIPLNESIATGRESAGSVSLNDAPLRYLDADGWQMASASAITLMGAACATAKSIVDVTVTVSFPCDATATAH